MNNLQSTALSRQTTVDTLTVWLVCKWVMVFAIIYLGLFMFFDVFAEETSNNPLANVTIASGTDNNIGSIIEWAIKILGTGIISIAVIYAFSSVLINLVQSLGQSVRDGNWGGFFMYLMMLFLTVAVIILVGGLAFTVLDKIGTLISATQASTD